MHSQKHSSLSFLRRVGRFFREVDPMRLVALLVFIIHVPAMTVIALALVMTSPGPAFVCRRYRRPNGETVELWEFRTECWNEFEPTWLGRLLRQTTLARMPALVNVLKGDVGVGERVKAE